MKAAEGFKIYEETVWIVNDEWKAQDVGTFMYKEDAEAFMAHAISLKQREMGETSGDS